MRHNAKIDTSVPNRIDLSLQLTGACRTRRGTPSAEQHWYFTPQEAAALGKMLLDASGEHFEADTFIPVKRTTRTYQGTAFTLRPNRSRGWII